MKKIRKLKFYGNIISRNKTLLTMKLIILLLTINFLQISASVYSQNNSFKVEETKLTLQDAIKTIEEQTNYRVAYSATFVDQQTFVNFKQQENTIDSFLEDVVEEIGIGYLVLDNNVIVLTDKESKLYKQDVVVKGIVKDATGAPLPGVNIVEKGTVNGTITNIDGEYSLSVSSPDAVLSFSFVGFLTEDVAIGGQTTIDITLVEDIQSLDEVVVVGYGSQSKRTVTGSIQSVGSEDLADMPVTTTAQKLQGKLSGVQINQTTGRPGEGMKIRVRGQASLTAGNDPLYVVDGFPITGDISSINPNEIESISVLKDASSAALYGSRAANGVVLVTTKHGKLGKTSVSLASNFAWQAIPERGRPEMMNAQEFAQFRKEHYEDLGVEVPEIWQNPEQYGEGSDFYDALLQVAPMQDYNLSFSTSNDNFRTTAVVGYLTQEGAIINSDYDRYSLRINSDFQASKKIKTGFSLAPTYSISNSPSTDGINWGGGLISNALSVWPIFDYENEDGTIPQNFSAEGSTFANPYWSAQAITNETKNMRLLANSFVEYEPIEGLVLKTTFNFEHSNRKSNYISPSTVGATTPTRASAEINNRAYSSWLNENTATYKKSFGDHNFDLLGGMTIQKYESTREKISYVGFADDRVPTIEAAQDVDRSAYWLTGEPGTLNDIQEWSMMSYLARINYNYKNRYLLSVAVRSDGSSRFGEDNRWGTFPSASIGWIVSEENFLKDVKMLSLFKLRGSYGVVGNNNIGNYTQYATVSAGLNNYNAIFGNELHSGSMQTALPNSTLTWEQTSEIDFGFDAGFFDSRINLTYDYYNRTTTSLLYSVSVAQESGYSSFMANVGELQFWGHEFIINTKNLVGEFSWETSFNISFTDNKVNALSGNTDRIYSGLFDSNITKVGDKVGLLYGMVWDGVYDNQDEYDNSPKAVASEVGTIKYKDVNGDGVITQGGDDDDRTVIGDPTPDFTYGITNNFAYKNFDLSVVMSGSYGHDLITWNDQSLANLDGNYNVYKDIANRWRSEDNPGDGRYGKSTSGTANERDWVSSRFVSDASFMTIKNVTLGYSLSTKKINNLRVFMSVQQLYTFTKYRGVNPESGNSFYQGNSTSALTLGGDFGSYPVPRTISFGINVNF